MPAAMAMGQAAGIAVSMAIADKTEIRDIDVAELQAELKKLRAILD